MVTGAVLAGGESRRFGRNKALEIFRGKRLIDRGVEALRPYCDPLLVVANDLSLYLDVRATLVQDVVLHQGPLTGIYTALLFSPNPWVLARATDMPFLIPELLDLMLHMREGYDAVVPVLGGRYEPLWALYSRRCIPVVAAAVENGERKVVSFYPKVRVNPLAEEVWRKVDPEALSFANVNTPEDWKQLQWN